MKERIANEVRRIIAAGHYENKLPTATEVAEVYGVSRATVDVVYRLLQEEGLIRVVDGVGALVGENPQKPPPIRIGALALFQNPEGEVLIVKPTYREKWQLPGGGADANEHTAQACAREFFEELGISSEPTKLLVVDYRSASPESRKFSDYNFVFNGGVISNDSINLPPEELSAWAWIPLDELGKYTFPYQERRIRASVWVLNCPELAPLFLVDGEQNTTCPNQH